MITSTTHKSLRGPRGGMILTPSNAEIAKKIDSAIFPGLQGGPMMHTIAGKAACFYEAMQPGFVDYQKQVLKNARAMVERFQFHKFRVVSSHTDSHLFLVDLSDRDQTGKKAEKLLESIGVIVNKNTVPGDKRSPFVTSGFRVGTLGLTTRGFEEDDCCGLVDRMVAILKSDDDQELQNRLRKEVVDLCEKFPIYQDIEEFRV